MSRETVNFDMYIGRNNRDEIHIEFTCSESGVRAFDVRLAPEQFGLLITGRSLSDVPVTYNGDGVGKRKIIEKRTFVVSKHMSRDKAEQFLLENAQEPGWNLDNYLGSQTSITHNPGHEGGYLLNYRVFKYEDIGE